MLSDLKHGLLVARPVGAGCMRTIKGKGMTAEAVADRFRDRRCGARSIRLNTLIRRSGNDMRTTRGRLAA